MSDNTSENWPFLEVRIRKLMSELIEPSLLKLQQTELIQSSLAKLQRDIKDRISTVEGKLDSINSRIPSLDPINRRVAEQYLRISTVESDSKQQVEGLKNQVDSISSSLGSIASQVHLINKQTDLYKKHIVEYASNYNTLKRYIEDKVTETKAEFRQPFESQSEQNIHFETQLKQVLKNLDVMSKDISYMEFLTKKNEHDLKAGLNSIENKNSACDENLNKMIEQVRSLKKIVQASEVNMKMEFDQSQKKAKEEGGELVEKLVKRTEDKLMEIMEFVLIETRYKKKIEELKGMGNMKTMVPKVPEGQGRNFRPSVRNQDLGYKENIENLAKKSESSIILSQHSLNSLEKSLDDDVKLALEDVQQDLEKLKFEFVNFSESIQDSLAAQRQHLTQLKFLILGLKHNFESKYNSFSISFENSIHYYVQTQVSTIKNDLHSFLSTEQDKRNNEILKIQQSSSDLETILKQSSFEFSNFVSSRKRENSDVKLDIKRLYTKLEQVSKEQQKSLDLIQRLEKSVKLLRDLLALQVSSQKKEEKKDEEKYRSHKLTIVHDKSEKKTEAVDRQNIMLETLNSYLDASTVVNMSSISQRSFTPELPILKRHK